MDTRWTALSKRLRSQTWFQHFEHTWTRIDSVNRNQAPVFSFSVGAGRYWGEAGWHGLGIESKVTRRHIELG